MSAIHYFQRYSQPENVITNNTLLLFSRLYNDSPKKFSMFLNEFLEEGGMNGDIRFSQQEKTSGSVPDGIISRESFKIILETKRSHKFSMTQLSQHLNSFKNEHSQFLIALSHS